MTETANQKAFNKAYLGLRGQGFAQSVSENGETCLYRGVAGRRCAAGWLIPDSKYRKGMEFKMCTELDAELFGRSDIEFIEQLQQAHDIANSPDDMRRRLTRVAERCGLTIPA